MGLVVTVGERGLVQGYLLAGARVVALDGADDGLRVRAAWRRACADGAALVVLTPRAAALLPDDAEAGGRDAAARRPLRAVVPDVPRAAP